MNFLDYKMTLDLREDQDDNGANCKIRRRQKVVDDLHELRSLKVGIPRVKLVDEKDLRKKGLAPLNSID